MLAVAWQRTPYESGSHISGQRFNPRGVRAFYLGRDSTIAIAEFYRALVRPGTLVAYAIRSDRIVDLTNPATRAALDIGLDDLGCPWWQIVSIDKEWPPSWTIAERLIDGGADGALVPSFQRPDGVNLVLWRWTRDEDGGEGARVTLIDPHGELGF